MARKNAATSFTAPSSSEEKGTNVNHVIAQILSAAFGVPAEVNSRRGPKVGESPNVNLTLPHDLYRAIKVAAAMGDSSNGGLVIQAVQAHYEWLAI